MMPLAHARRSCVTTKIMQQRTFAFQGSGPTAAQAEVRLWCREPPEAQAGKTLTWQLDSGDASGGQQPPDGAPPPAAAAAAAQPAAAGSNVAPQEDPDLIGLDVWPASIALCRYLANHPEVVAGQQVVELGAGALPNLWGFARRCMYIPHLSSLISLPSTLPPFTRCGSFLSTSLQLTTACLPPTV